MDNLLTRSIVSGLISVVVGVAVTALVAQFIATSDLEWALIAVGFASFFSGLGGYIAGHQQERELVR